MRARSFMTDPSQTAFLHSQDFDKSLFHQFATFGAGCNIFCPTERLLVQDFRYCFLTIRKRPTCLGEVSPVSSATVVLASPTFHEIFNIISPPVGRNAPRMDWVVGVSFQTITKDHVPLPDVHLLKRRLLEPSKKAAFLPIFFPTVFDQRQSL
jgi:hypothetical protein